MRDGAKCQAVAALLGMETPPPTILLVEDHVVTRRFLVENFAADGYAPVEAGSVAEGRAEIERACPDAAVVDLGLPDGDGLDLVRSVRGSGVAAGGVDPALPIILLTGRGTDLDRLRGLRNGADDYLIKPFNYLELELRVAALLRRARPRMVTGRVRVGDLELDPVGREVRVGGKVVPLSSKEFGLLRALAAEPTRVFTRDELLRTVWGYESFAPTRTLDSHAFRLRRKLGGGGRFVVNVWGVGYRLVDGDRP